MSWLLDTDVICQPAKRHGDARLATLRERGVGVEKFLGFLGWSCGWLPEIRAVTLAELIARFQPALMSCAAALSGHQSFFSTRKLQQAVGWQHHTSWRDLR